MKKLIWYFKIQVQFQCLIVGKYQNYYLNPYLYFLNRYLIYFIWKKFSDYYFCAVFLLFFFLMFFLFLPFRMAKLKVLILVWIGYEWMGTFIHCVNFANISEGKFHALKSFDINTKLPFRMFASIYTVYKSTHSLITYPD